MKPRELLYLLAEPFLPALYGKVRRDLKRCLVQYPGTVRLLDVGGRKSWYTTGLRARVTVLELPRESDIQKRLNLGLTREHATGILRNRSNIAEVLFEDVTRTTLPDCSFDIVVAVEVIEHVQDDQAFVKQICRVLRPGGTIYLTTPNGDYIRNEPPHYNPDHVRHYERAQLESLLSQYFEAVLVTYGIKTGKYRYRGLQSMSIRQPGSYKTALYNIISHLESRNLAEQPRRTPISSQSHKKEMAADRASTRKRCTMPMCRK